MAPATSSVKEWVEEREEEITSGEDDEGEEDEEDEAGSSDGLEFDLEMDHDMSSRLELSLFGRVWKCLSGMITPETIEFMEGLKHEDGGWPPPL